MAHSINVNGERHDIQAEPDTPLLWVLRDHLQLTGTKFGCGRGLCGACTVHLDGIPARSCLTQLGATDGKPISTIEALEKSHQILVDVWVELNVAQCGYCQAGQLMSASALLSRNSNPSDEDIDAAMTGNICRCGAYTRIRNAIHLAAERMRNHRD